MPLPGYLSTATITFGPYLDLAGDPAFVGMQGKLTLSRPMVDSIGGGTINPTVTFTIASDGTATVGPVVANDDPAVNQGTTYTVTFQALSYKPTPGNKTFQVLRASGATVDYDTIANADGTITPGVSPQVPLVTSVNGHTGALTLAKADVGLGSVDNTADASKPVSTAQAAALAAKANIADVGTSGTAAGDAVRAAIDAEGDTRYLGVGQPARTPSQPTPVKPVPSVVVSPFQAGHGWTITSAGSTYDAATTNLNDTADFVLGTQAATISTVTTGPTNLTLDSPTLSAIDTTSMFVRLLVKIENMAAISSLRFYLSDSTFANYTNLNLNTSESRPAASYIKDSEWTWITVNLIDGSVTGNGSRSAVTKFRFSVSSLAGQQVKLHVGAVQLVKVSPTFPSGVVSMCFDDGRASPFTNAKPKLDSLGWRASAYPIIDKIAPAAGGAYLTLAQLQQLRDFSGWEIGTHANTAADHDAGFSSLTPAAVEADIQAERQWLYANGLGRGEGFAWPLGDFSKAVADAAAKLVAYGRLNTTAASAVDETWPPENHMRIRSYAIGPSTTLALAKSYVDRAKASAGWISFTFHEITTAGTEALAWSTQNFSDLCDYIVGQGMPVLPILDVIKKGGEELVNAARVTATATGDQFFVNNHLTAGEGTFPRVLVNGGSASTSGTLMLTYFTAEATETITQVKVATHNAAAAATPTLCRIGVYSVDGSGNAALVASTANDTTLFAAANTVYQRALSASFSKVAGQRYAVGVLVVSATTMPQIAGNVLGGNSSLFNNDTPRLVALVTGQTDLPASYNEAGLNNGSRIMPYAELLR